jgi:mannose-6-phosphate isomerase-like protein (cupin superfamily)
VRPGEATTPHDHDEEETFVILSGCGAIHVDGEVQEIEGGDVIYLPRHSTHYVENRSSTQRLDFLSIFWGSPEANARMIEMARQIANPNLSEAQTPIVA